MRRDGAPGFQVRQPHLSETLTGEALGWSGPRMNCRSSGYATTALQSWGPLRGSAGKSLPLLAARRKSDLPWRVPIRNPSGLSATWSAPAHATTGHRCNPFVARLPLGRAARPLRPLSQSTCGSAPRTVCPAARACLQHLYHQPPTRRPGRFSLAPTKRYNGCFAEGIVSDHVHWQL